MRQGKSGSSAGVGGAGVVAGVVIFVVIVLLAVGVGYFAYRFWESQQQVERAVPTVASGPAPVDLVSDDRIIFGGVPRSRRAESEFTVLRNRAYMVGYSEMRKDPLWSAYRVIRMATPFILERPKGEFLTDLRTEAKVTHHDYTGGGYDRGHMTPNSAIARCYGAEAQKETFFLSNICPQAPNLNREVWEKLEKDELEYTARFEEIWVVDGPVFGDMNGGVTHTLRSGIAIPSAFYKIVLEDEGGRVRLFCVVMPQGVKGTELPQQFLTSVGEVERETGLEFLWKVEGKTREGLESQVWPMW